MNLISLEGDDYVMSDEVVLRDRRLEHARKHLALAVGDRVRVGLLEPLGEHEPSPNLGEGEVLAIDREGLRLRVRLGEPPPPASPIVLALALPRPPTLEKVLQHGSAMGIKRFAFFHARRTEKSYWQAGALEPAALRRQLVLGLEQARDTVVPAIELHPRFRPFVEDRLAPLRAVMPVLVADPEGPEPCPRAQAEPLVLVIGPEGGFVEFERQRLRELGDRLVHLGPRILRVEAAMIALLGRLAPE
ncbi:16S rRNA (uracil(1498)-N(3))-methyltransferase [Nannocystaceae bacterium ST9]